MRTSAAAGHQSGAYEAVAQPHAVCAPLFPRAQELVFDAPDKAFVYGGVCRRGIYDNMKTAVEAIFVGKARQYNRRFLRMCSHHLIEPVACTPASGWEKGQVEILPAAAERQTSPGQSSCGESSLLKNINSRGRG
jgi:transposase